MPELPEVRTVCAVLRQKVLQKTIAHVAIHWPKLVKYPTQDLFTEQLIGQQIQQIKQKGKHILFLLDDFCLISHLRMEGKYFYIADPQNMTADVVKHALVIFTFTDQSLLVYHDTRRFGTMHLYRLDQYEQAPVLLRVGPEPFVATVNGAYLWEHYQKTRRPIKTVLLEQQVMSGLGNIYANEVLFATKINPYLPANQLNVAQCEAIVKASRKILTAAIAQGGYDH